jgi:hypothetical protein
MKTKIYTDNNKQREYPQFSTAKQALEHFRFISILLKYDGIPRSYVDHIRSEIERFDNIKHQTKQTYDHIQSVRGKIDVIIEKAVINNINRESFKLAIQTKKTSDGVQISNYLIKTVYPLNSKSKMYDIINLNDESEVYYGISLYEIAFLLTVNTMNGLKKSAKENQELLKSNLQYQQLQESIKQNESKFTSDHSTNLEKQALEPIISGLKNQLLMVKQLVNAQYKHKINSKKV